MHMRNNSISSQQYMRMPIRTVQNGFPVFMPPWIRKRLRNMRNVRKRVDMPCEFTKGRLPRWDVLSCGVGRRHSMCSTVPSSKNRDHRMHSNNQPSLHNVQRGKLLCQWDRPRSLRRQSHVHRMRGKQLLQQQLHHPMPTKHHGPIRVVGANCMRRMHCRIRQDRRLVLPRVQSRQLLPEQDH